ncbi:unnamed protein product [Merluccius merluccius]
MCRGSEEPRAALSCPRQCADQTSPPAPPPSHSATRALRSPLAFRQIACADIGAREIPEEDNGIAATSVGLPHKCWRYVF